MASITPTRNGPYMTDDVQVLDTEGNVLKEGKVALCRCGQSSNKPFCDGTHSSVGFEG